MAYKFLVYVTNSGRASLCEGGVYTDQVELLESCDEYANNNFENLPSHVDSLNQLPSYGRYESRDDLKDVNAHDPVVKESLVGWQQLAIIRERMKS